MEIVQTFKLNATYERTKRKLIIYLTSLHLTSTGTKLNVIGTKGQNPISNNILNVSIHIFLTCKYKLHNIV